MNRSSLKVLMKLCLPFLWIVNGQCDITSHCRSQKMLTNKKDDCNLAIATKTGYSYQTQYVGRSGGSIRDRLTAHLTLKKSIFSNMP